MQMNLENCLRNELPKNLDWLRDQLVSHLKELRDRARKGQMSAVLHEFLNLYRFDDNQMDNDGFWGPDAKEVAERMTMHCAGGVTVEVDKGLIEPPKPDQQETIRELAAEIERLRAALNFACTPPFASPRKPYGIVDVSLVRYYLRRVDVAEAAKEKL